MTVEMKVAIEHYFPVYFKIFAKLASCNDIMLQDFTVQPRDNQGE